VFQASSRSTSRMSQGFHWNMNGKFQRNIRMKLNFHLKLLSYYLMKKRRSWPHSLLLRRRTTISMFQSMLEIFTIMSRTLWASTIQDLVYTRIHQLRIRSWPSNLNSSRSILLRFSAKEVMVWSRFSHRILTLEQSLSDSINQCRLQSIIEVIATYSLS